MFKVGDKVVCVKGYRDDLIEGSVGIIEQLSTIETLKLGGTDAYSWWDISRFQLVQPTPNYAAAFNMWMSDYMSDPQAYEDSHDSAVRHLKEKLNGEEPSYGAICAEVLVNYLNKLEQLELESK